MSEEVCLVILAVHCDMALLEINHPMFFKSMNPEAVQLHRLEEENRSVMIMLAVSITPRYGGAYSISQQDISMLDLVGRTDHIIRPGV